LNQLNLAKSIELLNARTEACTKMAGEVTVLREQNDSLLASREKYGNELQILRKEKKVWLEQNTELAKQSVQNSAEKSVEKRGTKLVAPKPKKQKGDDIPSTAELREIMVVLDESPDMFATEWDEDYLQPPNIKMPLKRPYETRLSVRKSAEKK
jgi:hypothetical protein